jgi:phosphopantothenoylcysteine decarboxylase/phosphopantothenate--cysteine ligase
LENKNLDLIVANDVSREDQGIGSDKNQVTLIWKDGQARELPVMDKTDISDELVLEAAKLLK